VLDFVCMNVMVLIQIVVYFWHKTMLLVVCVLGFAAFLFSGSLFFQL
jgi:hypothetical protein